MSKKYIIVCNEDNSFSIENSVDFKPENEVKDIISFCLQYLYTVLNQEEIMLPESAKQKVIDSVKSFQFDEIDIAELTKLITKLGSVMNKQMMVYDNGIPKLWEDEV
jgi:hypothetical protein